VSSFQRTGHDQCVFAVMKDDSPVSLLRDGAKDLEGDVVFVQFPLDRANSNNWYEWKGSQSAPLVVFDPEHSGVITSAKHLFGPWN
jgi:hypothetical protein